MDEERIRQLTAEVMGALRAPQGVSPDVEERLARLEAAIARIEARLSGALPAGAPTMAPPDAPVAIAQVHVHPALQVLAVSGGSERCVLEPDKPCVQSQACRTFGH